MTTNKELTNAQFAQIWAEDLSYLDKLDSLPTQPTYFRHELTYGTVYDLNGRPRYAARIVR